MPESASPERTLVARPALAGARISEAHCDARTVAGLCVASIAARRGAAQRLDETFAAQFDGPLPGHGMRHEYARFAVTAAGHEQWFATGTDNDQLARELRASLGDTAVVTDQSGAWTEIRLTGSGARAVLERLCPVDLSDQSFAVGAAARTVMEHLGVQVALVDDTPTFSLLTPSSSAPSFWTALGHAMASTRP